MILMFEAVKQPGAGIQSKVPLLCHSSMKDQKVGQWHMGRAKHVDGLSTETRSHENRLGILGYEYSLKIISSDLNAFH